MTRRVGKLAAVVLLLALAIGVRAYDLDARPLHADEAGNFHHARKTMTRGYYPYTASNYHGPLYFYALAPVASAYDYTPEAMRATAVLYGALLCLVPFMFLSFRGGLLAGLLLALTPSLVFYSRYAIHEMLFGLLGAVWAALAWRWIQSKQVGTLYAAALTLALMISTKETFVLTLAGTGIAAFASMRWQEHGPPLIAQREHLYAAFFFGTTLTMAIFSGAFVNSEGLGGLGMSLVGWSPRGFTEHVKPATYYVAQVLGPTEPWVLLGPLGFILRAAYLRSRLPRLERYVGIWAVAALTIYSLIPYKTPWLTVSIVVPAILALALPLEDGLSRGGPWRAATCLAIVLLGAASVRAEIEYNHVTISGDDNPFGYVDTSTDVLRITDRMAAITDAHPDMKVLIATNTTWPLRYYLRHLGDRVHYLKTSYLEPFTVGYAVILAPTATGFESADWSREEVRIHEATEGLLLIRKKYDVSPRPQGASDQPSGDPDRVHGQRDGDVQ